MVERMERDKPGEPEGQTSVNDLLDDPIGATPMQLALPIVVEVRPGEFPRLSSRTSSTPRLASQTVVIDQPCLPVSQNYGQLAMNLIQRISLLERWQGIGGEMQLTSSRTSLLKSTQVK